MSLGTLSSESPSALGSVTQRPGPTGSEPSAGWAPTDLVPFRDLVGAVAGRARGEGTDPASSPTMFPICGEETARPPECGVSVTAAALTRDHQAGAGEAESRRPGPHTVSTGPDYSTSCGAHSVLIRREKRVALGIRQHHPTTAEPGTPRPASPPEGSLTRRVWPRPPRPTPVSPALGSGAARCAWGLPEDFPDLAGPRARAACPSGGFQGLPGSQAARAPASSLGCLPRARSSRGRAGNLGSVPALALSPAAHLRTQEPLPTQRRQRVHPSMATPAMRTARTVTGPARLPLLSDKNAGEALFTAEWLCLPAVTRHGPSRSRPGLSREWPLAELHSESVVKIN